MNVPTRWMLAGLTLGLALVGGGCAATDEAGESTMPTLQDAALDENPMTPPPASSECLHGTWLADNQFIFASATEEVSFDEITGEVFLTYAPGGTLTTDYREWRMVSSNEGEQVTVTRNGVDHGEYTLGNGTISFTDLELTSVLTVSAADVEMTQVPEPVNQRDIAYTCEGDLTTMETSEGIFSMKRQ